MNGKEKKENSEDAIAQWDDEGSDLALLGSTLWGESDESIMDSGCTYYMCLNQEWFSSTKMLDGGSIFMGNDHACKTLAMGKVRMKLHDGSVRTLFDVW